MTWTPEDLALTAGDGEAPGMAVVDCGVSVRAHRGVRSRWYRAASERGSGRIRGGDVTREVRFTTGDLAPTGLEAAFAASTARCPAA